MNKKILQLAIPNIISNITIPLLGMVDMIIVGHMGNEQYIGAVAVGAALFNLLYWNFGFLRMGTSGFAAQAYGRRNLSEAILILARSVIVGLAIALTLVVLQQPMYKLAAYFIDASEGVQELSHTYFSILIWAAPATLSLYSLKGWFIGMQNSKTPMFVAIIINLLNIAFSLIFVLGFGMKVEGVAWGSLLAQYGGLITALIFFRVQYRKLLPKLDIASIFRLKPMLDFFKVNGNIFIRTFCLVAVFTFFTSASAKMGDTQLAVNALLLQLFTLFSYIMDGFAYAGEALVGRYIGAQNRSLLKQTIQILLRWGLILSLTFTLLYFLWGGKLLGLLTNQQGVVEASADYFYWVLLVPIAGFSAFLWDGILIGASSSRAMRNAMLVATGIFFAVYYLLYPYWYAHALWLAFILFLSLRGILQHAQVKTAVYAKIAASPT